MVLSRSELIASLQNEVRILLHLVGKVNPSNIDYRPTPKQRSVGELVQYLSFMGPTIVRYALAEPPEVAIWTEAEEAAKARNFDESVAEIGRHSAEYEALLGDVSDAKFRAEFTDWEGKQTTVGAFLVNLVLQRRGRIPHPALPLSQGQWAGAPGFLESLDGSGLAGGREGLKARPYLTAYT